jgi:hypothetical protein
MHGDTNVFTDRSGVDHDGLDLELAATARAATIPPGLITMVLLILGVILVVRLF